MRKFDNLLARFDKDANGKLSIQEFMAWMQELTEEQGGFYEQDYYDVIKTILTEFLDENGELNREGATKMQESIETGKYDELFARHFEKYSLNPTETMADEALWKISMEFRHYQCCHSTSRGVLPVFEAVSPHTLWTCNLLEDPYPIFVRWTEETQEWQRYDSWMVFWANCLEISFLYLIWFRPSEPNLFMGQFRGEKEVLQQLQLIGCVVTS